MGEERRDLGISVDLPLTATVLPHLLTSLDCGFHKERVVWSRWLPRSFLALRLSELLLLRGHNG